MEKTAEEWFNQGDDFDDKGEKEKAIYCFDQAIALNPDYHAAHYNKGLCLSSQGKKGEAIECYEKVISIIPNDAMAYYSKGSALDDLGKKQEAIVWYDKAISLDSNYLEPLFNKACILDDMGEKEQAVEWYDKVINLDPNYENAFYNKAILLSSIGRKEEAIKCFDQVILINPKETNVLCGKGSALAELGKIEEALICYDQAIIIDPDNTTAYFNKGSILDDLGERNQAIEYYDKAISVKPDFAHAHYNKGVVLRSLGKKQEALDCYNLALSNKQDDPIIFYSKASVLNDLGDKEQSLDNYDKAITLDQSFVEAHLNKGLLLSEQGKKEEAIKCYDKTIALNPNDVTFYHLRGSALSEIGKQEEALKDFEQAICLAEKKSVTQPNQSYKVQDLRKKQLVIEHSKLIGTLDSIYNTAYYNKGKVQLALKNGNEALESFNKALSLLKDQPLYLYYRGACYIILKQEEKALLDFTKASELLQKGVLVENYTSNHLVYIKAILKSTVKFQGKAISISNRFDRDVSLHKRFRIRLKHLQQQRIDLINEINEKIEIKDEDQQEKFLSKIVNMMKGQSGLEEEFDKFKNNAEQIKNEIVQFYEKMNNEFITLNLSEDSNKNIRNYLESFIATFNSIYESSYLIENELFTIDTEASIICGLSVLASFSPGIDNELLSEIKSFKQFLSGKEMKSNSRVMLKMANNEVELNRIILKIGYDIIMDVKKRREILNSTERDLQELYSQLFKTLLNFCKNLEENIDVFVYIKQYELIATGIGHYDALKIIGEWIKGNIVPFNIQEQCTRIIINNVRQEISSLEGKVVVDVAKRSPCCNRCC